MHPLLDRMGLRVPIVQAPMAGGPTTAELVAAVGAAGALGSIGAAYLSPEAIREVARDVRARNDRPFALNLFVGGVHAAGERRISASRMTLAAWRTRVGLPEEAPAPPPPEDLDAQIDAVLEVRPAVFSFTFGIAPAPALAAARERGIVTVGTATTVEEARALAAAGVDAVCAQGAEAGGHRGTFIGEMRDAMIGTLALVPQVVDAVAPLPVFAAGGIADARGVAAAFALGAVAAHVGTAFLRTTEAGTDPTFRAALADPRAARTRITRAFSGREARGIVNRFMEEVGADDDAVAPYPMQNGLTREIRRAGAARGDAEVLSLWAGQAAALVRDRSVAELVRELARGVPGS